MKPQNDRSDLASGHDRQRDIRRVAKILRDGGYSYDQSKHLFAEARRYSNLQRSGKPADSEIQCRFVAPKLPCSLSRVAYPRSAE